MEIWMSMNIQVLKIFYFNLCTWFCVGMHWRHFSENWYITCYGYDHTKNSECIEKDIMPYSSNHFITTNFITKFQFSGHCYCVNIRKQNNNWLVTILCCLWFKMVHIGREKLWNLTMVSKSCLWAIWFSHEKSWNIVKDLENVFEFYFIDFQFLV